MGQRVANNGRPARLEWLRAAHLADVELLAADTDSTAWHLFHERYVLCSSACACAPVRYRGKLEPAFDGSTLLMEPGETHRNPTVPAPQDFRVVFIEPSRFARAADDHGLRATPHFRCLFVPDPELFDAVYRLCAAVERHDTPLTQQSLLLKCVHLSFGYAEQARRPAEVATNHRAISRAQDYLRERFDESVSLDELSAYAGLSAYHLVRSFTRVVGMPPHAYQIHIRVERARALLAAGIPPAEIAAATGFADQSHFTRHFRRILNVTPAKYARAEI